MNKTKQIILWLPLVFLLCVESSQAQDNETAGFSGKDFTCYLYSTLEVVDTQMHFAESFSISLSRFNGSGLYLPMGSFFIADYLAFNLAFGGIYGDFFFLFTGTVLGPFITGSGFIIADYEAVYPFVFIGYTTPSQ